jgi:ABC-type uncharacterized transport system permease subunit
VLLAAIGELGGREDRRPEPRRRGHDDHGRGHGFIAAAETGSVTLAFLAGMAGGMILSAVFGFLTQVLLSNQVATGLALTLFGIGLAALLGVNYPGASIPRLGTSSRPRCRRSRSSARSSSATR